ncbi:hypothetical protein [Crocosphaera sp. Alani8]|uniref:hypothetical protein n=1 Tax=Crocosphaera sp. Alani8 TaxID=3038952 RepID=UPI00313D05CF
MILKHISKQTLGSEKKALKLAKKGYKNIPAYQKFLDQSGVSSIESFSDLPITNKKNYILKFKIEELIPKIGDKAYRIAKSSGSSGKSTYYFKSTENIGKDSLKLRIFLESNFQINHKPTLVIMALNYPAWGGSENLDLALKNASSDIDYTFYTFSCGMDFDSIIDIITLLNCEVEQIVLIIVPSFIFLLQERAKTLGYELPLHKLRYMVVGEFFPEEFRINLQNKAQILAEEPFLYSFYGSTETTNLGAESLASICMRKILCQNPSFAENFGFSETIPSLLHFSSKDTFIEVTEEGILVTKWQSTPLFRYFIGDRVSLYSWRDLKQNFLKVAVDYEIYGKLLNIIKNSSDYLPDILAIEGRSDKCLILGGVNVYQDSLNTIIRSQELEDILTGIYYAKIIYHENGQQALQLVLETKTPISAEKEKDLYTFFIRGLCEIQTDLREDWKVIYNDWENNDVNNRILALQFHLYPKLSQELFNKNKHQGILP